MGGGDGRAREGGDGRGANEGGGGEKKGQEEGVFCRWI